MMKDLNWRPLDQRPLDSRPIMLYKVTYDLVEPRTPLTDLHAQNSGGAVPAKRHIRARQYKDYQTSVSLITPGHPSRADQIL